MIWFFLAGFIAGIVGMMMYANWWCRTHLTEVTKEELLDEIGRDTEADGTGSVAGRKLTETAGTADWENRVGSTPEQCMEDEKPGKGDGNR